MTDKDTLMNLIDEYAEVRHINGCWVYNTKTAAARQAVIEALSGVQALSAAPNGWESVIDEARSGLQDSEPSAFDNSGYRAFAETVLAAVEEGLSALAASPTPQALSAAPAGWKLVPEDATEEMVRATDKVNFANADTDGTMHNVWNVMLAASPPPTPPAEQQAPSAAAADTVVLGAALRAIHQAIDLIGEPDTERLRTVRRVLRGAVIVAEDAGEAATAPQPAPAPQADSQRARNDLPREDFAWLVAQEACETEPADEDDPECIRILRRDLKSAVLAAFLRQDAASAPAGSVTTPAAYSGNLEQELAMLIRRIVSSARRNCEDGSNVLKLANEAWAYLVRKGLNGSPLRDAGIETDPTPPAQAADSVLEDAARLEFEMQHGSAIDAARKQGGA